MAYPSRVTGLAVAATVIFGALATAAKPHVTRNPAQWAHEDRYVAAESGSSRAGKWDHDNSPLAIEPMECLGSDYPCREVVIKASAQVFKTEVGINWVGQTICDDPCSFMVVLPSLDELKKLNNTKFQPTVDNTPTLKTKVFDIVERSRAGSNISFKRFPGGYLVLTTASSSKGLQGSSIKRLWGDEVSEFPADAGGRGDPVKQARARCDAHDDSKILWTSTPKDLPNCRITGMYEKGDQRKFYAQCPHCLWHQVLLFENMLPPAKKGGRVEFQCIANGCVIDEIHKPFMLGRGDSMGRYWIRTYPSDDAANPPPPPCFAPEDLAKWRARPSEGRDPSFWAWQAYSKLRSWSAIWKDYEDAQDEVKSGRDPDAMKVFHQQKLGLAWDAATDAPDAQKLFEVRGKYVKRGVVPAWACEVVLCFDVQGDRLEWAAYAMGPDLSMARFDWGNIDFDPLKSEAWAAAAEVIGRRWPGEACVDLGADLVSVDSGGQKGVTERVYRFVRARANVLAIKGSSDWQAIPVTAGKRVRRRMDDGTYVSAIPWFIGGWGLKFNIYSMLEISRDAADGRLAGGLYNPADATLEDFKQYTSEVFVKPKANSKAGAHGEWHRIPGQPNEQLDLAVYARAMFWKRGAYNRSPAEWQALMQSRLKTPQADLPLFDHVAPMPVVEPPANPGNEKRSWYS